MKNTASAHKRRAAITIATAALGADSSGIIVPVHAALQYPHLRWVEVAGDCFKQLRRASAMRKAGLKPAFGVTNNMCAACGYRGAT